MARVNDLGSLRRASVISTHAPGAIADFRALFPEAPVVKLPGVGHFCQEDAPETLVALIQGFVQANP